MRAREYIRSLRSPVFTGAIQISILLYFTLLYFTDYDVVEVRQKGAGGINAKIIQRGDDIVVALRCKVHSDCRKRDINQHDFTNQQKEGNS